jgi:hypothetical protein
MRRAECPPRNHPPFRGWFVGFVLVLVGVLVLGFEREFDDEEEAITSPTFNRAAALAATGMVLDPAGPSPSIAASF